MATFTGNVNLLVAAPMLQDYLVDKDGTPMSGGTVTCYHDNSRTTLKNWYYQSGTPGNYTYIALPNPLTLSAAGTISDLNGVDTIPFYYPVSELDESVPDPYYITIVNNAQTNQITRANFPFEPSTGSSGNIVNSFNNLIANNGFWRNLAPNTLNVTPFTSITLSSSGSSTVLTQNTATGLYSGIVAPSQHDGFRMPDIQYVVNNLSATDVLTFTPFSLANMQPISNTIVPEYYVSHNCTNAGTGVSTKCYQFPISLHVNTLANVPFTFSFQAQNAGGTSTGENVVTIFVFQDTGTGTTSPAPIEIAQFTLTPSWNNYTISSVFPATSGLVLGNGADDALYLQIQIPLGTTSTINFTKPSIYLTSGIVPNYDLKTYDQVDTIINSPRTGDIRVSANSFVPYGWVPMNDGTIGNGNSNATTRSQADVWQLFNLLWSLAKSYDTGSTFNAICQMYNSAGSPVNFGANAITDFNANNQLALTQMMGKVMLGTVPITNLLSTQTQTVTANQLTQTFTASSGSQGLLLTSSLALIFGEQVQFSNSGGALPSGLSAATTYYVIPASTTTFYVATSLANAQAGTFIAFATAGTGTNSVTSFALVFTSSTAMNLFKGAPIAFTNTGGALPTGIVSTAIYYAAPITTTTFCVATSFSNAQTGNYIVYTNSGTGTTEAIAQVPGSTEGEYAHTQMMNELVSHNHSGSTDNWTAFNTLNGTVGSPRNYAVSGGTTAINIVPDGTGSAFNITQPGTFYNLFIKL